ncbi:MAG: hypothetical protein ACYCWE_11130 [Eubacteriales bacterium]
MKNIPVILICFILLFTVFIQTGCADTGADESVSTGESSFDTEPQTDDIYAGLITENYDGYVFRVLNSISNFALTQFDSEELDGEIINDAVFERNRRIEEKLKIKISEQREEYNIINSSMDKCLQANEDAYDIFFNELHFVVPYGTEGYLYDINDLASLKLDREWWNQSVISGLTIGNTLYVLCGELHFMFQESAWVLGFNKSIQENYSIGDIYGYVKDGTWSYEIFWQMINAAADDLDGDGKWTAADQFGATAYGGVTMPFIYSSGEKLIKRDSNNMPYYELVSERFVDVYETVVEMIFNNTNGGFFMEGTTKGLTAGKTWHDMFIEGKTLFYCEVLGSLKKLRQMDNEFGIVPFPKYDDTFDYVTLTASYAAALGIPITNPDAERTAVIIDNLCAESHRSVKNVYYNVLLEGKYIRDNESSEMLDIIFGNRIFALEQIYGWGNLSAVIMNAASAKQTGIASKIAAIEEKINTDIGKTTEYYLAN